MQYSTDFCVQKEERRGNDFWSKKSLIFNFLICEINFGCMLAFRYTFTFLYDVVLFVWFLNQKDPAFYRLCHVAHLKMPVVTYLFFKIRNHKPKWCFFLNRSSVWRRVQSRSKGGIRSISETNNLINEVEYIVMVNWYNFKAFWIEVGRSK